MIGMFKRRYILAYDRGYVFGGSATTDSTDEYTPSTDSWVEKSNMLISTYGHASSTMNNKGYLYGGAGKLNTTYEYYSDTWTLKTGNITGRQDLTATSISNLGYVLCGTSATLTWTDLNEEYNPTGDSYTTKTATPKPLRQGCASTMDDKGYLTGGNDTISDMRDTEEYTPTGAGSWVSKTDMDLDRYAHAMSTINDKVYVYCGFRFGPGQIPDTDEYVVDTWTAKLDYNRTDTYLIAGTTIGDKGYIFGGHPATQTADEYDPVANIWIDVSDMPLPARHTFTATPMTN